MEPVAYGLRRQSVRFYRILTMETTKITQIKKLLNSLIFKCCIIFNQVLNALSRWWFFKIIFSEKKVSESRFVFPDFRILKILNKVENILKGSICYFLVEFTICFGKLLRKSGKWQNNEKGNWENHRTFCVGVFKTSKKTKPLCYERWHSQNLNWQLI